MLKRGDIVFIDTNSIAAAHAARAWGAVRGGFKLRTAVICLEEATRPDRHGRILVNKTVPELAAELDARQVDDAMRFHLVEKLGDTIVLDAGERDLIALALAHGREVWCFCGPDKAALRALHYIGWSDRMVSLEEMMQLVGLSPKGLEPVQTKRWLGEKRTKLKLGDSLI
jgi:hypothetical protein